MSLAISCAWCGKPLVEVNDAKRHVMIHCPKSPAAKLYRAVKHFFNLNPFPEYLSEGLGEALAYRGVEQALKELEEKTK